MLRRRDLVVLGLGEYAELPQRLVHILHVRSDARLDSAEVVILQFLSLGRLGAEERATGELEVNALLVEILVDQKIFLFRSDGRRHSGDVGLAEKPEHLDRFGAEPLH